MLEAWGRLCIGRTLPQKGLPLAGRDRKGHDQQLSQFPGGQRGSMELPREPHFRFGLLFFLNFF